MTLRRRLYVVALLLLVLIALAGVVLVHSVETTEVNQADRQLTAQFVNPVIRASIRPSGRVGHLRPPKPVFKSLLHGEFYVANLLGSHRRVVEKPLEMANQSPKTPSVSSGLDAAYFRFVTVSSREGNGSWRAILIETETASSPYKAILAMPLASADATISQVRLAALLTGLVAFLTLLAAGAWVYRLGLRPIAEVTDVADRIAAGDRRRRVTTIRPRTEAGRLAHAFNIMLDEQQALEKRLRQFVADASHELRTPLSVIKGLAGLWRQGELRSGEANDDAMRRIGQESERMARLVEDLLLLARLDEGQPLDHVPVDLVPLIEGVIADMSVTYPSRAIKFDKANPAVVRGDAASLRRVILNLATNAVMYTPASATVAVTALAESGQVALEVRDSGPGMDADSVTHAFDRFWRAEASRTRSGSGLGLAIVAGIVGAHGGEIALDSTADQGTSVRVVLPEADQGPQ
jgi:two-component system, OmpR family, sensor kinase